MPKTNQTARNINFYVMRFAPGKDPQPYFQSFSVPTKTGMTVLEGLHFIKENFDQTLAWRYSCRMGVCGSCGMLLNGSPSLACNTQILDIASNDLTIGPLPNFDIVRDLVPDLDSMFDKHREILPFILRDDEKEINDPAGEYYQTPEQLGEYLQFTLCIKCGCCMAACPTLATDARFLGPMPLTQAQRYSQDTRDGANGQRMEKAEVSHGVFRCHYAGECSRVCPKGVDPAKAIQYLKRRLFLSYLHLAGKHKPCSKQGHDPHAKKRPGIPEVPPYTVANE